jgi:hypothetical protein
MSVTRLGVSLENVVATIDKPANHHGTDRPEAKKSDVFLEDHRATTKAGKKLTSTQAMAMIQSRGARCMKVTHAPLKGEGRSLESARA